MDILNDQPLYIANGDKLNRTQFAENLAKAMLSWNNAESVCLALHGPWGAGKTSIINICLQYIGRVVTERPEYERPIIMKFQPWMISEQAGLIKSFLQQLRIALNQPNLSDSAKTAAKVLGKYENALGYVKLLPGVAEYVGQLVEVIGNLRGIAESLTSDADNDLDNIKETIRKALAGLPAPIIIIIDDMDRLPPHEIRQIFQLVKAVADFPKTIYLLAYDPFRVNNALKEFNPEAEGSYIEKIVQLDFEVPQPSHSKVAAYLWSELNGLIDEKQFEKLDEHRWRDVKFGYLPYFFKNIREVKRYVNMVNFRYPLVKGEVNLLDLLFLEAIRMFAPNVYEAIRENGEFLLSDSMIATMGKNHIDNDLKKEWLKSLPKQAPEKYQKYVTGLLKHLFPEAAKALSNQGYGDVYGYWNKAQRVCLSVYYRYYFDISLGEGEVSRQETCNVIDSLHDVEALQAIFTLYLNDNRLVKLLSSLELLIDKTIKPEYVVNIMQALSTSVENMPPKSHGMMEISLVWDLSAHVYRLIRMLPAGERKKTIDDVLRAAPHTIWLPVDTIRWLWIEWHQDESDKDQESLKENTLTQDETEELKQSAIDLIRNSSDIDLLYTGNLSMVLHVWASWTSSEEVTGWVSKILSDDKNIPRFLLGFGGFASSGGMESHYTVSTFVINPKSLESFCDVEGLRMKCQEICNVAPDWLGENEKTIIEIFLKGFSRRWF